ncbi:MAG: ABC-F family ATP-binding cassette domain-containing protein [Trueperella sp.]|nr:ABC-F family ATP-binding cassette domain-containing protein [Trueperella sp.]
MAHILSAEDVAISLGSRPILADINLSFAQGARIGIVGPNGGGKTTLLRILTGALSPDAGRVTTVSGTRFAVLRQGDRPTAQTVQSAIHGSAEVYEWASDAHVRELHAGLIPDVPLDAKLTELSGGQRRRVALVATLCQDAEVVVLDEPTNHLDLAGVDFLANYLRQRFTRANDPGALLVVTHDRWFLDAVCDRLWEVVPGHDGAGGRDPQPGRVETYEGGYAAYILQRAERARLAQQAAEKRANLLRKELAWLRRGAPARTSKPRFRIEAANELIANEPPPRDSIELAKLASSRLGKRVVDLLNVSYAWPGGATILHEVTLRLAPGERIGILGANGAGKSSLLGLLNGTLPPTAGTVRRGQTVVAATLSQETRELDEVSHRRVVEAVADIATHVQVGKKYLSAGQLVEMLGFTRERAWTLVSELSGGERRRLQLLRLLIREPNLLLLDEPTNDLDTDTLAAIEDLLDSWPGTLVVVSHDRYLLERITDHQVAVVDGTLRDLPGGVDQYLEIVRQAADTELEASTKPTNGQLTSDQPAGGVSRAQQERQARKAMERAERRMARVNAELVELGINQGELAANGEYDQLADIGRKIAQLQDQLAELEEEWLAAGEEMERARPRS